jgi:hypothetical protein
MKTALYCLVGLALMLGLAGTAGATVPPPPGPTGHWGHDCGNWVNYTDPWASGWICYDPAAGSGGGGWLNCSDGTHVTWPGLDIQLWVEMECALTWDRTKAQIHRYNNFDDFCLTFDGTSSCNNGQYIITTAAPGAPTNALDFMWFKGDMFGDSPPRTGPNIPAAWTYTMDGSGAYYPMTNDGNDKYFLVDACDHYFTIAVCLDMVYHQPDGYYELGGPGYCICPATPL